jgi:hypothetical protein
MMLDMYFFNGIYSPVGVGFPEKSIKVKMGKGTDFSLLSPH